MKRHLISIFIILLISFVGILWAANFTSVTTKLLTLRERAVLATNAYLDGGAALGATNAFTTTATADTVVFNTAADVDANSIFVVSIKDATPVANDLLSWTVTDDSLFIHRPAGTTSALAYSYIRVQ